jgi:phenylacetate-coenzyme A ligase PaaK-like adenylate-forming protein
VDIALKKYTPQEFEKTALEIFRYQAHNNSLYRQYIELIGVKIDSVKSIDKIPFLPIGFFKYHKVITGTPDYEKIFMSSGTTQKIRSKHYVKDINLYIKSFTLGFQYFFRDVKNYCLLALLPSYMEQGNSSLIFMIEHLIKQTQCDYSGFYLYNFDELKKNILKTTESNKKVILFGVSYALLDFAEFAHFEKMKNLLVFETGGMKGRRKELPKDELHKILKNNLGVETIYSEYGMTELLSQAYSLGNQIFTPVPWMKILIRDKYDPFSFMPVGKSGGINIIDFANINSCSFIETEDLGRLNADGSFEILGRFDTADIRGCNLMVGE